MDDIVNRVVDELTGDIDTDSFLRLKCDDFNMEPIDLTFNLFDCEIDLSSRQCYRETVDSLKDILKVKNKHFDRDKVCKSYLASPDEKIKGTNPFDGLKYIEIGKLPKNMLAVQKSVSNEAKTISSPLYLSPRNSLGIKNRLTKQIQLECSLSSDKDGCVASKAFSYTKAEKKDYSESLDDAYRAYSKNKYLAINRDGDLYESTDRLLKKLPIEKRKEYMLESLSKQRREALSRSLLNSSLNTEEVAVGQFLNVTARSIYLSNNESFKKIGEKSTESWTMP